MPLFDVIVVGLGAMGSATLYQLSRSGATVLGIDRYTPPHPLGSSHGDTRFTRLATGEGAEYVPLVRRSHELWRDLERQTGYELFQQCGGLLMSAKDAVDPLHAEAHFIEKTIAIAERYHIKHEVLAAPQLARRFPQFALTGTEQGYFEPDAGLLRPEQCIRAQLKLARRSGAAVHTNERVLSFQSQNTPVTVVTDKATYHARRLVLCTGPWVNELFPGRETTFKIYRQVLYWFELQDAASYARYRNMPVYAWAFPDGFFYGFPAVDGPTGGIKVATEDYRRSTTPARLRRAVAASEITRMRELITRRLPGAGVRCLRSAACMYTVTPDNKFVIDFHPRHGNVIVASPCSGHGFKHSAAIGEILAQLALAGRTTADISAFSLDRF